MAFHQKNSQCSPDEALETSSEAQSMEVAQVSEALERGCASSDPPVAGSWKEAPDAEMPSSPESAQSFCFSSPVTTDTPSSESDEESSTEEEEAFPDPKDVSINSPDAKKTLLLKFLVSKYQMKELIAKAEMVKVGSQDSPDDFLDIFQRACTCLDTLFGLDVKEVDPVNHLYAIFLKMGLTYDGMQHGEEGWPKTGVLILTLGAVFMNGNRATEEEVWEILNVLELYPGEKHPLFGDPSRLIKHLVEEGYLMFQQVGNRDPPQVEFLWGPRAHAETTKMQVLEFMAKIQGINPRFFRSQYVDAFKDELRRRVPRLVSLASFMSEPGSPSHPFGSQG